MRFNTALTIILFAVSFVLQGCSDSGFHLRKNLDLPVKYQRVQIDNLHQDHAFVKFFQLALEEAGGELLESAPTKIQIHNFQEGRRVVAYTSERRAREYLLFLRFEYSMQLKEKTKLARRRVNVDRTFIYDANFALGKAEEENQIRNNLYEEASRLMLLRLQYTLD